MVLTLNGGARKAHAFLETSGHRALRFWNRQVLRNFESVVDTICAALYQVPEPPTLTPPRRRRGEGNSLRHVRSPSRTVLRRNSSAHAAAGGRRPETARHQCAGRARTDL
ncbi:MAG: DUF559 domain-containing protein [Methylocystis sp.]|uniref:DUF559 domain-containing protein n=1 Tax=Methylocystis sp. TaxID=1911079 RepID=UPI003D142D63